jgi:type III pantothenate kinase
MLLAVDAGNTNLVFALVKDGEIRARWRIATDPRRTADEYAVWLHQLLELEGYDSVDVNAVIIGTVVPRALHNLEVLSKKYFQAGRGRGGVAAPARRRRAAECRRRPRSQRHRGACKASG